MTNLGRHFFFRIASRACASTGLHSRVLRHAVRYGFVMACAFASATPGHAQNPPLLDRPNVDIVEAGVVSASVRLPDGSLVVGGSFKQVNGVPRQSLFKRRPDGSLDPDWNPAVSGRVSALAADAAGNIYVGGAFSAINLQPRRNLARLAGEGVGVVDPDWNPAPNAQVYALALDAAGDVLVGGAFSNIGGQARHSLAKLSGSATGAADADWNPAPDGDIRALAIAANGDVFAGGDFIEIGGQTLRNLAKLSGGGSGAADAGWRPSIWGGAAEDWVSALALGADGDLFVGGAFHRVDGFDRICLVKLATTGSATVDPDWDASTNGEVLSLAVDAGGDVWAAGSFTKIGGREQPHVAKLSGRGSGGVDPDWHPSPDQTVQSVVIDAEGRAYIGGGFETIGALSRLGFATLSPAGVPEAMMDVERPGIVRVFARQPDAGTIVGGSFLKADGYPRRNLLRLQADGSVDPDWQPSADHDVFALALDAAGDVYVGGAFEAVDAQPRTSLAKLSGHGSGALDADWRPAVGGRFGDNVYLLAMDATGDLYVSGSFETIDGLPRPYLAKFATSTDGQVDPIWNPSPSGYVDAMDWDAAGNLYIGGSFGRVGGVVRGRLAKLSARGTGVIDANWNPSADGAVAALAVDAAGDVFVGGSFTAIGGLPRQRLAKLSGSGTGTVDANWTPSADKDVATLAIDAAGDVYVGGEFGSIDGQPRARIARLSGRGDGAPDPAWSPAFGDGDGILTQVSDLKIDADGTLWSGGWFTTIDGERRKGIAAFGLERVDFIFIDGFESPTGQPIDVEAEG